MGDHGLPMLMSQKGSERPTNQMFHTARVDAYYTSDFCNPESRQEQEHGQAVLLCLPAAFLVRSVIT